MNLEEIYQEIDKPGFVIEEQFDNRIIPLFKSFGDEKLKEGQTELAKFAQVEIDVQGFHFRENKLHPTMTGTNSNGEYVEYPSIKPWAKVEFDYVVQRQRQTGNPYLKAKYSHLLWLSPQKHFRFASDALKAYVQIITNLNKTAWDKEAKRDVHDLKTNISNALYLASSTGNVKEIAKVKSLTIRIARKFRFDNDKTFTNVLLMDEMLSHPRIFKGEDFKTLDKLSLKYALQQSSLDTRIDILNIAIKAARKMKTAERPYLELIAQSYEGLSRGKDDMIAVHNAQEAIKYYRQLKNKAKVKELEDRYKDAKQNMELGVVPYEFDRTEIVNAAKGMADNVLKGTTEKILGFLMYSPLVIPTYQSLYDEATKRKGENFLQFLFPTTIFDDFGHTAAHYVETDEKTHLAIMQSFNFRVQVSSLVFIHGVIFGGIKKGKLSSPAFLKFIRHHSWLGQGIKITYSQKEAHTYNWLHTIAPGINDFFSQLYFRNINQLFIPNFVLAIDSLTLKIEGIIRDMCELRGINTFYQTVDSKGRNITREKDINMLLRDDEVKGILSADDLIFLQFLFVDKAGWNLRNKVAHTLMREVQEYGLGQMLLLLLAILRLAKNEYGPQTRP